MGFKRRPTLPDVTPSGHRRRGWTLDYSQGHLCWFEHFELAKAERKVDRANRVDLYVVETINETLAADDPGHVHRNEYFVSTLPDALEFAVSVAINTARVAEYLVGIRPASASDRARHRAGLRQLETQEGD